MWFKKITFLIVSFFSIIPMNANGLDKANSCLKSGKYDEAISSYESIVKEGFIGFELFFNLGTAYSKKGDVPNAILNFEKALRIKPMNKIARQQLVQLNLQLRDKPAIYEDTGLLGILKKIQFGLSIDGWAFLSIFLMLLVPTSIYISYKFKKLKRKQLIFLSSIFWFLLSGISVLMARNCYHYKYLHEEAIVFPESIKVFDQPDNNSLLLFNLHQGTKVEILDSAKNMYEVQYSEKKGWITEQDVKKIQL
jgi:tetratricopeptide (TPR) repeat protein